MFEDVTRKMSELESGVGISIKIALDDNGFLDRKCPADECSTHFKILYDDWRNLVRDEGAYCPRCRGESEATQWNTDEQEEYFQEAETAYVMKQLDGAFSSDVRKFNSKQSRDSLISIKLSYRPGIVPIPLPAQATDVMTQEFTCEECSCRYSSIGAVFFCPACGHNSVLDTFVNSVETVKETIAALPMIRKAIESSADVNVAEDSIRHICENGLVKIVSSFQRYAESCFQKLQNASQFNLRLNLFQNLDDSDAVWRDATSTGYTDILTDEQYSSLIMYFQQRHLLAHRDGVVDQLYLDRTGDHRLAAGQRLIVAESSISDLASVIEKLAAGIEEIT